MSKQKIWPKKKWKQALLIIFITLIIAIPTAMGYLSYVNREPIFKNDTPTGSLVLSSSAFEDKAAIPTKYTAQGENINPPLNITGIPLETKSLAVIVYDPVVANVFSWTHWVVWNLPANDNITENTSAGIQGRNGWNRNGYEGPDPLGQRTYVFTVYALDTILNLNVDSGQVALLRAMDNHVLAKGQLSGTYAK